MVTAWLLLNIRDLEILIQTNQNDEIELMAFTGFIVKSLLHSMTFCHLCVQLWTFVKYPCPPICLSAVFINNFGGTYSSK